MLNGNALKSIATANDTAKALTDNLGARERHRSYSNLDRVRSELETFNEEEFMGYWKALEAAGIGSIVVGRHGRPTRFVWGYSLKDFVQAASTGSDVDSPPLPVNQAKVIVRRRKASRKRATKAEMEARARMAHARSFRKFGRRKDSPPSVDVSKALEVYTTLKKIFNA